MPRDTLHTHTSPASSPSAPSHASNRSQTSTPTRSPTLTTRRRLSNFGFNTSSTASRALHAVQGSANRVSATNRSAALLKANRDSFYSILDDPLLKAYNVIAEARDDYDQPWLQDGCPARPANEGHEKRPARAWPPPRQESLKPRSQLWFQYSAPPNMESFNVAVIGSTGVGKSTFIQNVLGLPRRPITNSSSVRMVVDTTTHMITLVELDLEHFELSAPSQPIQWPKQINGHIVPRVDAALILYDVMDEDTVHDLPQTLAALTNSGLPAMLVATKCENAVDDWEVDPDSIAGHKHFQACIGAYKVSADNPEIGRACLQAILRAAVGYRRLVKPIAEENGEVFSRRRAQSNLEAPDAGVTRPISQQSKHSRASSDFSLLKGFSTPNPDNGRHQASKSPRPDSGQPDVRDGMLTGSIIGMRLDRPGDTFPDMEESDQYSDETPILQRNDDRGTDKNSKAAGVTFDELVDRLLAPRLSKADANFSDIFLCLYRKFAAPGELFSAILARLDRVRDDKTSHYLTKTATQLRIIEVVARWVSLYPGDFARAGTRRALEELIRHLATEPIFSISAQHMRQTLHRSVTEDDDTGWANTDGTADPLSDANDAAAGVGGLSLEDDGRLSECSDVDRDLSMSGQSQYHQYDLYEKEAALMEPTEHLPMDKTRYHSFMEIPVDDVADELTRIEWVLFSSIRIRDFVRHVSLSPAEKEKCKGLRNVNRMINHFNHTAQWVANMILLRDKAKHRAQILEKFMNIALKLRQLNNYNGLAAILAGINGTAIHRLAQTRNLVPAEVQKRFARLVILMGTQKSHFAYRLAWENSPLPRIPFIPLHRRDLVSAEEGSKTFVGPKGDRINWKKFEVLGEVLLPVMRSQGTPYPNLGKHDTVRGIILGCRMPTDDEEIYQRSVQVESGSGGSTEPSRKKAFPWFAK
ncbi:RasGEF [Geosmithia morbida]|uniref:RasGEF n=1 Tax=Geosmithia morbida TaxID=1094350 RepID=A0A9P5D5B6_9HYPO|nr:RasGEF [Geosmithia morbida]KAF4123620.1 RasGEF [Geosmithia morbida]